MRRELGRQLAARRKAAGYLQREFGVLLGYSRTAVANAETGHARASRQMWQRADQVLGTGELFARGCDRIQARLDAEARAGAPRPVPGPGCGGSGPVPDDLESPETGQALQACEERGWPAQEDRAGGLWLVTGTVFDVLEVPRPAGMLAVAWWLYTRGVADEIRGLPALPDPAGALAVVAAGPRCYFLTQAGACPWTLREARTGDAADLAGAVVVRWHAYGGRVPAPPSRLDGGERVVWAHVPCGDEPLVSPVALLHVLGQAVAATREDGGLVLPGGVRAVPAAGTPLPPGTA
jgi:transcriptional regulator with XRE-family HTH domain